MCGILEHMATYIPQHRRPVITIDHGQGPRSYYGDLDQSTVHSDGSILFCNLALTPLSRNLPKEEALVNPENPYTPEDTTKQAAVKAVKTAAQQIERTTLSNARDIERAILAARLKTDQVDHEFNMAVLESLHAGVTEQELRDILEHLGFSQLIETVDCILELDTEALYVAQAE